MPTSRLHGAVSPISAAGLILVLGMVACDRLTTEPFQDEDRFDTPIAGLTQAELALFAVGDAEFDRRFTVGQGLGPLFNNVSCASCHSADGRGLPSNALQRVGSIDDNYLGGIGPQIKDKAIPGAEAQHAPPGVAVSVRLPPPVFGVGLLEAIPESDILARADPNDSDGDGISGRPNWVTPPEYVAGNSVAPQLGRFGRKAQVSTLLQIVAGAYREDIGITSDFLPDESRNPLSSVPIEAVDRVPDPEIPASTVLSVAHYIRTLAPPAPGALTPQREEGRKAFAQVRCSSCHVPMMRTGVVSSVALSNRDVPLYSDLLLHDMGDGLADRRPDGSANGREWRTPPLWGMRLVAQFLNGKLFLLHDGRAQTVEQAILAHGGEAQSSRDAFVALSPSQKQALLDYVSSR